MTRIDPGAVSLVAELRGKRQAAEELERRKAGVEECKVIAASPPAAITLALLLTDEQLDSLEKSGLLEMEKSRGADDQVGQMSQALNRLRAMVSLPKYSPPMARPPTGDRGWRA